MEDFQTKAQSTSGGKDSCCCGGHAHNSLFKVFLGLAAVFLFVLILYSAAGAFNKIKEWKYIGQGIEAKNTITISDSGEIYAKPDLAITSFSVITEAKTVAEAISENTKKMNAVTDAVKKQGVEEKDLKTINFSISPHYDYYDTSKAYPYEGQRVLSGYDVTQSLQVKIRSLEKVGSIIQAAIDNGSNEAGDLQFTIDNQDELKKQAREEAIKKTKAKAEELASQLGVKLVRIVSFSDSNSVPYYHEMEKSSSIGMGGGGDTAPQIQTGENKIQVTVSITYEID
ncbi:MAG: SIMPL domain-containing protein [Candidatus Nealsonbacteria bacterium]|nr:SIMPL domain-containing protein [Candidatus Nealsonbacteria bacterium]